MSRIILHLSQADNFFRLSPTATGRLSSDNLIPNQRLSRQECAGSQGAQQMRIIQNLTMLGAALLASTSLHAADWTHEVAPYLWGTSLEGTTTVGPVSTDVDASFSDILDALEFGAMGSYRGSRDRISVMFDVVYAALGGDGKGPAGAVKANVDVDQLILEGDFGYALTDNLHGLIGLRYVDLETKVTVKGPLGDKRSVKGRADWVDPVIGLYYIWPFSDRWSLSLRGDIGGFGVGSEFAWQGVGILRWQTSPRVGVLFAYRYLSNDYDEGKGTDYFKYDMSMQGPALGVVFTFH